MGWGFVFALIFFFLFLGTRLDWSWVSLKRSIDKETYKRRLLYFALGMIAVLGLAAIIYWLKGIRHVMGVSLLGPVMILVVLLHLRGHVGHGDAAGQNAEVWHNPAGGGRYPATCLRNSWRLALSCVLCHSLFYEGKRPASPSRRIFQHPCLSL